MVAMPVFQFRCVVFEVRTQSCICVQVNENLTLDFYVYLIYLLFI